MTVPSDYLYADRDFRSFMERAKEKTDLPTTNMAWGVVLGVFEVFRRRLDAVQRLAFASALPPTLRAIFCEAGAPTKQPVPFANKDALTCEVQEFHRDHQFASDTAIDDVASALAEFVDLRRFRSVLDDIGPGAVDYWSAVFSDELIG
ncbi:DUF2267 domain-containing protein [Qipengyuania qiaonensis]|uniref:DUF2267 domain-containing protein n=1 Tax=Qipengyuania qiaonensis TaxID=2867240 RepID=A0ABS7JBZ4_9SPHN|nr:DUF2267 domain-containing protein [Qipengyuania qiaonensis]MBX7482532.1 DUF2267 domain-containing protein [Qipengyuania qiaonensis]